MTKDCYILVGAQGSGKSTFCRESLPHCTRISQDDQGRVRHKELFLQVLQEGKPVVVDRINHKRAQRKFYLDAARAAGYTTHVYWLTLAPEVCVERALARKDHPTLKPEFVRSAVAMYVRELEPPVPEEADHWKCWTSL